MTDKLIDQDQSFDIFFEKTFSSYVEKQRRSLAVLTMINFWLIFAILCADAQNNMTALRFSYLGIWFCLTGQYYHLKELQSVLSKEYKESIKESLFEGGRVVGRDYFLKKWGEWTAQRAVRFLDKV